MNLWLRSVQGAVGCLMLLAAAGCSKSESVSQQAHYVTLTVQPVDRELLSAYSASIRGRQDIDVYPQVNGTLTRLCVSEGERVRRGQLLFVIDQVPYRAALATATANVEAAEAVLATARLTYDSKQVLHDKQVVSEFDLSTARNAWLAAKAQLARGTLAEWQFPSVPGVGVPLQLLSRRPDVRMAEHSFATAYYAAAASRSAFYPAVILSGSAGWTNSAGSLIVNPGKMLAAAVASLTQPIFQRGALLARNKIAVAQQQESALAFR